MTLLALIGGGRGDLRFRGGGTVRWRRERTGGEEETVARREVLAELGRCRWRRGVSASNSGLVSTVIDALLSS
jgi:hypothetical protein